MKFNISEQIKNCTLEPIIGNVYNMRGGSGARKGYMMVIVSIHETSCVTLTVDKDGNIVGANNYGLHYFEDKCPIAFCQGLEDLSFDIRSI